MPLAASGYWIRLLTDVFLSAVLARSVNLISGYTGYAALGNIVFWGAGAYTAGILMTVLHRPFVPAYLQPHLRPAQPHAG